MIDDFLKNCLSCGACQEACPFLSEYGTPDVIIKDKPIKAFLCTNCRACNYFCPQDLLPSEAIHKTKYKLIKEGNLTEKVKDVLRSSEKFAKRGHKFPFSHYPKKDIVFWPGCSLSGTSPEIVKKIQSLLSNHFGRKVGIVLDCCFDPLYQLGDLDNVEMELKIIKERIERNNIRHIITGCVNCKKIFSLYIPEIRVEHLLDVLPENIFDTENLKRNEIFLHHPCPSFRFMEIQGKAKYFVKVKDVNEINVPSCCGLGGGIKSLDKELSEKFSDKILSSTDSDIITYCMGCKNNFLNKGRRVFHILEFLPDVKKVEKPVSSMKKWLNRFFLSLSLKLNIKKLFLALIVLILIILITDLRKKGILTPEIIFGFIQKYRVTAPLIFILIYAIGPSLFIPSLPLTLGAGFLWGPFWGVIFSITGATIGASVAFLIARYILGDTIKERFSYLRWQWLKERVEKHGWKAVAFARIVPIFPFPVLNYLFGLTPVPFIHYLWSTFVFMLPACIAYVAFGSSMGELILKGNIKGLIIGILIATAAFLLPLFLKPFIKKVFPK